MYRLLAIAKYEHRYVIPAAAPRGRRGARGVAGLLTRLRGRARHAGRHRSTARARSRCRSRSFHLTKQRAEADSHASLPEAGGER